MGTYLAAAWEHLRQAGVWRVFRRAIVIWALNVVALGFLIALLPGLSGDTFEKLVAVTLALGLVNALLRPIVISVAVNLPLWLFAFVVLLLDVAALLVADSLVDGFHVDSFLSLLVASFGLTALTTLMTGLLHIDDDDSFYRNVILRAQRRSRKQGASWEGTGTVIIQIDGLSEPVLRLALREGRMPNLEGWLNRGTHKLAGWECDLPSMTSSSQAGILWGNNEGIPAFRWFDKEVGRLLVSNRPRDAQLINQRQATEFGLLEHGGASINNIFTGGTDRSVMTMAAIVDDAGKLLVAPRDFGSFFVSPYNLTRMFMSGFGEICRERWEAWRQKRQGVSPRMHRSLAFSLQRAGTNVLLQQLAVWLVVVEIESGSRVSYCDLLGYDEVAHHAGPYSPNALRCLTVIDRQIRALEKAAEAVPDQQFQFVVLSDHGQSWGATFRQRYGMTLEQLVAGLIGKDKSVFQAKQNGEGAGYVSATLSQLASVSGSARRMRSLAGKTKPDEPFALGEDQFDQETASSADVVVCASGNLGLISFTNVPRRLSAEEIEAGYPGLLDGLIQHPGVGWAVVQSDERGPLVLGKRGVRHLDSGQVNGEDPLSSFPPATQKFLRRLAEYRTTPDIVLNSTLYDSNTGEVAAFEELIGCHGGAGGDQTKPFLVFPAGWGETLPQLEGAEQVHDFLMVHIEPEAPREGSARTAAG